MLKELQKILADTPPAKTWEFFYNGDSLGFLDEVQATRLRIFVAKNNVSGVYAQGPDNMKINMKENGDMEDWPCKFYDEHSMAVAELLKDYVERYKAKKQSTI